MRLEMQEHSGYFLDRTCLKHGKHIGYFSIHVPTLKFTSPEFCLVCLAEKMKELGVGVMTKSNYMDDYGTA